MAANDTAISGDELKVRPTGFEPVTLGSEDQPCESVSAFPKGYCSDSVYPIEWSQGT